MKFLTLFIAIGSFPSYGKDISSIYVEGECYKKISPDKGSVLFRVIEIDMKRSKSVSLATKKYNSLRSKVKSLKLKGLELSNEIYKISPENKWENRKQIYKGIRSEMALRVDTTDLDKMGTLLSIGAPLKITKVTGPEFSVSRKLHKKIYRSCLAVASVDARAKAEILAKQLNVNLGKAHSITERPLRLGSNTRGSVRLTSRSESLQMMDAEPTIDVGKQEVSLRIGVNFLIK